MLFASVDDALGASTPAGPAVVDTQSPGRGDRRGNTIVPHDDHRRGEPRGQGARHRRRSRVLPQRRCRSERPGSNGAPAAGPTCTSARCRSRCSPALYEDEVPLPDEGFLRVALFSDDIDREIAGHHVVWGPDIVHGPTFGTRRIVFVDAPGAMRLKFMEQLEDPA